MMHQIIDLVATITDGFVVVLLTGGMILAIGRAVGTLLRRSATEDRETFHAYFQRLRLDLGHILLLSLEVLIISDILHSIVTRSIEEIGILAVTVAIRISLSFFLDRELTGIRREIDEPRK